MEIKWFGQACFLIKTATEGKEEVKILIDVFSEDTGLKPPQDEAELLIMSKDLKIKSLPKHRVLINEQGEYEVKNIFIKGINVGEESKKERDLIYLIEAEDVKICHLGAFSAKELSPEQIEHIGEVDILTIPVGGGDVITHQEALKIINQIEPKLIIPMYYSLPKLKNKLEDVTPFLKGMNQENIEPQSKLSVSLEKLPAQTTVALLKAC